MLKPDIIEAGYTRQPDGLRSIQDVSSELRGLAKVDGFPLVAALAPLDPKHIEAAVGAGADVVNIFAPARSCDLDVIHKTVTDACRLDGVEEIQFTIQAATSPKVCLEQVCSIAEAASWAGANTISLADSAGIASPAQIARLFQAASHMTRSDTVLSIHAHNDLGLALANTLAAVENGARQAEVTIAGIGTRAGNCAAEELVAAASVCLPHIGFQYQSQKRELLHDAVSLLCEEASVIIGTAKPILGTGLSQDGFVQLDSESS